MSTSTLGLGPSLRTALEALPCFKPSVDKARGADRCPGWPEGYPAAMTFNGRAGVDLGTDGVTTGWAPNTGMGGLDVAAWCDPACPKPPEVVKGPEVEGPQHEGPVTTNPVSRRRVVARVNAGEVIDGQDTPRDPSLSGGGDADLIMADEDRRAEALGGGDGADVLEGDEHRQTLRGGGGRDYLEGADGPDSLDGGGGPDSLYGGDGDDLLSDDAGETGMIGGGGEDMIVAGGDATGGIRGQAGGDRLILEGDDAAVALVGGEGDDLYRLRDGADPRWATEFVGEGQDTIVAAGHSRSPWRSSARSPRAARA